MGSDSLIKKRSINACNKPSAIVYACYLRNLNEKQEDNKFNVILSYIVSLMPPGISETLSVSKYTNLGKLYRKLNECVFSRERLQKPTYHLSKIYNLM